MKDLPAEGREREIFLVALRAYSDACEPPSLHPECPFSIEVAAGVRGCGEECMDLLGEFHVPTRQAHVDLGDGFGLRELRSRPRRGPSPTTKPFDSLELHLADTNRDKERLGSWATVSLLVELRNQVTTPPPDEPHDAADRRRRVGQVSRELDRRSLDSERVLREGLRNEIAGAIFLATALGGVFPEIESDSLEDARRPATAPLGWQALIFPEAPQLRRVRRSGQDYETEFEITGARAGPPSIERWIQSAPLAAILDWTPPTELTEGLRPESGEYQWLVERLTKTYLEEWSEYALQQEWRFIQGSCRLPCPPKEVKARLIDRQAVAAELADRTVRRPPTGMEPAPASAALHTPIALKMLKDGRRSEAAALFEATIALYPGDASAHNNYAFCILPDNPSAALESLDRAIDLGRRNNAVTMGNRLLALLLLDRVATAVKVGSDLLSAWHEMTPERGHMWDAGRTLAHDPVVIKVDDVREYIQDVLVQIAARAGDPALVRRWTEQLEMLREHR